jgi:phage host-nuclease inhibitor protein Gam
MRVKAKNKIKNAAANYPIPRDRDEADEFIFRIGGLMRDRALIQGALDGNLAALKAEYEDKALPINFALAQQIKGLQTWCETNRAELLDGDSKTAKFGNGEVSWRKRPAKVTLRGIEEILAYLAEHELDRFVRVSKEVNKEAMLDDAVEAAKVPGVSIGSAGEDFIVTPLEAPLEKVACTK